ncbi:Mrx20p RNJ42_00719 [Nakaseomyces bracarensis]|uniref:Mrx20p n=1 Tax=Nakaseomyces bracarensis TaxID=273131 RepID=UPI0038726A0A
MTANRTNDNFTLITAGSTAAVFETTVTYPFEFLKTGLQLHRSLPGVQPFEALGYQVRAYFTGCSAVNIGAILKTSIRFWTFDKASEWVRPPDLPRDAKLTGPQLLMAGVLTGTMESLCIIPFENVKVAMIQNALVTDERAKNGGISSIDKLKGELQASKPAKKTFHKQPIATSPYEVLFPEKLPTNIFSTISELYRHRGIRAYFQGTVPTMMRQVGNSVVRFTTFTTLRQFAPREYQNNEYFATLLGLVSSGAVVAATQPLDVIKTRMQAKDSMVLYRNSINCGYRIFVEEGITAFWKGWLPRLMKVGLAGGVSFGIYQYTENLIMLTRQKRHLE